MSKVNDFYREMGESKVLDKVAMVFGQMNEQTVFRAFRRSLRRQQIDQFVAHDLPETLRNRLNADLRHFLADRGVKIAAVIPHVVMLFFHVKRFKPAAAQSQNQQQHIFFPKQQNLVLSLQKRGTGVPLPLIMPQY